MCTSIKLFKHQEDALLRTSSMNRVAYYLDMGLGKTFVGSEKMSVLKGRINLVICQKSKVNDWIDHFNDHYDYHVFDLTKKQEIESFMNSNDFVVGVINYDLVWRRDALLKVHYDTLMLDESSLIQNNQRKKTKFILKLKTDNVILLSGTPTDGKYERLWTQCHMLGWNITKTRFFSSYVKSHLIEHRGFKHREITGYKNVEHLKKKLREHGCIFMKTEEVLDLPSQTFTLSKVNKSQYYNRFMKNRIIAIDDEILVGDNSLTKLLYARQLCGAYNKAKLDAFKDIVDSTSQRLIVFYNFTKELDELKKCCSDRQISIVNGETKDLTAYNHYDDSITFIQYQAGAYGLNLQKSNHIVYFTLPLSSEMFEQSKKRIHRIGQEKPCFYTIMMCKGSVEEKIYNTLKMRKNYTDKLFEEDYR